MGKKRDLSAAEKQRIVRLLAEGATVHEVATLLHRDVGTVIKFTSNSNGTRKKRSDAGKRKIGSSGN